MVKAGSAITSEPLSAQAAAGEIVRLINSRPHSPPQEEIERVIGRVHLSTAPVVEADASNARPEYMSLIDEIRQFCKRTEGATTEEATAQEPILTALQQAVAIFEKEKIWRTPARTWGDVMLYAEAALYNENGIMMNLGDDNAYTDERAAAELINAVITVGRRFFGHEDNGERTGDV